MVSQSTAIEMASFTIQLLGALAVFVTLYKGLQRVSHFYTLKQHGCKQPPTYPHKDPMFGLDLFSKYMNAFKLECFLDFNKQMFDT